MKQILIPLFFVIELLYSQLSYADDIPTINTLLALPEEQIDLAVARLVIEKQLYPAFIDIKANLKKIDHIITIIQGMPEYGETSLERMGTVLRYLYTPGVWNNYQAYQYDLNDPFGTKKPKGKSIANYLTTKKGNCVSMPILVTILGQRLGVNVNLSIAPSHAFVRYIDDQNTVTNIEATSGTILSNQEYIESLEIHPEAIRHGIYLQDLTKKQAIAFMLYEIGRQYRHNGDYEKAHKIADLMLKFYPKSVDAMLLKGNIYSRLLAQELANLKAKNLRMTPTVKQQLDTLLEQNLAWFTRAEALGWREGSVANKRSSAIMI